MEEQNVKLEVLAAAVPEKEPKEEERQDEVDVEEAIATESVPASFRGRLNLASYTFSPTSTSTLPRRSARNPQPSSWAPLTTTIIPKPTPTPTKRKSATTTTPSPRKKPRPAPTSYTPPSTYAHLAPLTDILAPSLICVFIGLNPGITTSLTGHAYAHPSNLFWKLLHSSGCTPGPQRLPPSADVDLPRRFALGNTNIVARPTRNGGELSKSEMDASVGALEAKVARWRPEAVCLVGKGIWESVWRVRGREGREGRGKLVGFEYGWQEGVRMGLGEGGWEGARVFVACSTSGLAATVRPAEKERIWRMLGSWVEERRRAREGEDGGRSEVKDLKLEDSEVKIEDGIS